MAQWAGIALSVLTIIFGFVVSISMLRQGQEDTRAEVAEIRLFMKDMAKALERLATMAELHEDRLKHSLIQMDEIKGEAKRHGREIHMLMEWKAGLEERLKRVEGYSRSGD